MKKEFWLIIILAIIIVILATVVLMPPEWFRKNLSSGDNPEVKVFSVKPGQEITSPLIVEGEARGTWFFEASFPVKITDESGNVLGVSYAQAQSDWMTENFVPFRGEITYSSKSGGNGFLVFAKDNPSGLPEHDKEIKIPVIVTPSEYIKVKVYFNNSEMDPDFSCNKVFPAEREILKIEAIGSATLWQLLMGPTDEEQNNGFSTSINSGVKLKSLAVGEDGVARADFDEQLEYRVGGSCRVSAIRAQITETLKQFSTVNEVIVSINGRTEDILQP